MGAVELLARDRFAQMTGVRLIADDIDGLVVEMTVRPYHRDGTGRVAAGVLFSLADCAMSLLSNRERTAVAIATHFAPGADTVDAEVLRAEVHRRVPEWSPQSTWETVVTMKGVAVAAFTGTTLTLSD